MSTVPAKSPSSGSSPATGLACAMIVLAALAVYYNSFSVPLIFDDALSIINNPTIHKLESAFSPPPNECVGGRPILNFTFALNYALAGLNVWGYHAFNLLIHALAGLTLFGLLRRTLSRPPLNGRFGVAALPLALAVAVIWTVHPLQTEAVTYLSQRAESLMGLFYLLTLYCFVRGVESAEFWGSPSTGSGHSSPKGAVCHERRPKTGVGWQILSVLACLIGVWTKEIIVTAPVMVLLYDRTFVAGSFRESWSRHWWYYLGLAGTWLPMVHLIASLRQRGIGFDQGVTWWGYALTSCRSVVLYLKLAVWPHPLVLDYGFDVVRHAIVVVPYALILAGLVAATAIALWRRPVMGFAGAWFFLILAPASSVIPIAGQPMAEHRMYLSLAAVVTVGVLGLYAWIGQRSLIIFMAAAIGLGWLTLQRNKDYRTALAIWSDTVAKCPGNPRAHNNLGDALINIPGHLSAAISAYETAVRIDPDFPIAQNNLGCALKNIPGRLPEAIGHFTTAFRLKPNYAIAHDNLGIALYQAGRLPEATVQFKEALRIKPDDAEAHNNLGIALNQAGRLPEAIAQLQEAVRIDPDYAEAHCNLGTCFGRTGRVSEAIDQFVEAVRINPDYAEAHKNLGIALYQAGQLPAAIAQCKEALRIKPDFPDARAFLEKLQEAAK
jgi:tetratricopeptide (TPR) repeat protein